MQVSTVSDQLGLGSELINRYQDAFSVPDGQFVIDLSPRKDDRLRYCTNTGSIPERLKHLKYLDEEHKQLFFSQSVPVVFPQMQKSFPSVLPEGIYQFSL